MANTFVGTHRATSIASTTPIATAKTLRIPDNSER